MWWARSRLVQMYLGSTLVGVRTGTQERWTDVSDAQAAVPRLKAFLRSGNGSKQRVRVWLSAGLAKAFVVPADCGARNDSEALAIAQAMAGASTGMTGELSVWAEYWRAESGCFAVAMPKELLTRLRDECAVLGVGLDSVRPWWNLAVNAALREAATAGSREVLWSLSEADGMTLGTLDAGRVKAIDTVEPLQHDPNWEQLRTRAAMGGVSAVAHWHATAEPGSQLPSALPVGRWTVSTNLSGNTDSGRGATETAVEAA